MAATISNPASALGEKIGHVFEDAIQRNVMPVIKECGFTAGPEKMKNGSDNKYQIDLVVRNAQGKPVILIETKYIRYKKHNRDKGSWLCTAHYNLKKSHPSIRKLTAVLAGNWSGPSLEMMKSFGMEIIRIPFGKFVDVLQEYGIEFDWPEKDKETPRKSLGVFDSMPENKRREMGDRMVEDAIRDLRDDVKAILTSDMSINRRISHVEVVMKTEMNESIMYEFDNVSEAIAKLASLTSDKPMSNDDVNEDST